MPVSPEDNTRALVRAVCRRSCFDHPVDGFEVIETHISFVILTGAFAYKIKKPVKLPFVDFSTLDRRRAACYEELRVNVRLAPHLYLGVVPIGGGIDDPIVNSTEETIEYAVKMRQFPNSARLDRVLERGELSEPMVRDLAHQVARFHAGADTSRLQDDKQRSEQRFIEISENFDCLEQLPDSPDRKKLISELRDWSMESLVLNGDQLRSRRRDGFVRECHGDMHLENLALLDGRIVVFDALEFSESLRWTDVLCEVAFMVMDFLHRKRPDQASVFLSTYLEVTGDYEGLTLVRHYLVYRAMVRAKVSAFRYYQLGGSEERKSSALADVDDYLRLARHCTRVNRHPWANRTCRIDYAECLAPFAFARTRSVVGAHCPEKIATPPLLVTELICGSKRMPTRFCTRVFPPLLTPPSFARNTAANSGISPMTVACRLAYFGLRRRRTCLNAGSRFGARRVRMPRKPTSACSRSNSRKSRRTPAPSENLLSRSIPVASSTRDPSNALCDGFSGSPWSTDFTAISGRHRKRQARRAWNLIGVKPLDEQT